MSNYNRSNLGSAPDVHDQFCGLGGSSEGAEKIGMRVTYAINHDPIAISSHSANFPRTNHDCADISQTDPKRYKRADVLITSPECDYHSSASSEKRQPQPDLFGDVVFNEKAERSRATAYDVPRFAEVHNYQVVVVENVDRFRKWRLFNNWLGMMHSLDYEHEIVYINAMFAHLDPANVSQLGDFVPQSRDRMFTVFWKKGMRKPDLKFSPLAFCPRCQKDVQAVQSWKKDRNSGIWGKKGQYVYLCPHCTTPRSPGLVVPYYYAAANVIDWDLPIERIGDRAKALKPKTMDRIQKGIERYWAQQNPGPAGLLITVNHGGDRRAIPISEHLPTVTTHNGIGLVLPTMVTMRATDGPEGGRGYYRVQPITDAAPTQVATATQQWLLGVPFLAHLRNHGDAAIIDQPLHTVTAGGVHHALVVTYNGNSVSQATSRALPTVTTVDRHSLIISSDPPRIEDCLFRMLSAQECKLAQSFKDDYIVHGNKSQQISQIGNANPPVLMSAILDRVAQILQ